MRTLRPRQPAAQFGRGRDVIDFGDHPNLGLGGVQQAVAHLEAMNPMGHESILARVSGRRKPAGCATVSPT